MSGFRVSRVWGVAVIRLMGVEAERVAFGFNGAWGSSYNALGP